MGAGGGAADGTAGGSGDAVVAWIELEIKNDDQKRRRKKVNQPPPS